MAKVRLGIYECEDDRLPRVCMCCGAPSMVVLNRRFSWTPPWVGILILAGLLPYIIAASVTTKRCRVHVPLCDEHANHWSWRTWFTWMSFLGIAALGGLAFVIAIAAGANQVQGADSVFGFACVGSIGLFFVWLIVVLVIQNGTIKASEITDRTITLNRISPGFVDAIEELDAKDRDQWDDRDDDRRAPRYRDDDRDRFRR